MSKSRNRSRRKNQPARRLQGAGGEQLVRTEATYAELRSGPLPPPEDLVRYNDAFPGCAERVVSMAEGQADHRQDLEKTHLAAAIATEKRGQWFAFFLFLAIAGAGVFLLYNERDIAGYTALITGTVAPLAVFLAAKRYSERNLLAKWRALVSGRRED